MSDRARRRFLITLVGLVGPCCVVGGCLLQVLGGISASFALAGCFSGLRAVRFRLVGPSLPPGGPWWAPWRLSAEPSGFLDPVALAPSVACPSPLSVPFLLAPASFSGCCPSLGWGWLCHLPEMLMSHLSCSLGLWLVFPSFCPCP